MEPDTCVELDNIAVGKHCRGSFESLDAVFDRRSRQTQETQRLR